MEEKVYYDWEIKKTLEALSYILYYSKPWYVRWMHKPALAALVTIDLMLCKQDKEETIEDLFGLEE